MMDDIEDVYDAVNWLRRHGVQINDNRQKGGINAKEKSQKIQSSNSKRHQDSKNII